MEAAFRERAVQGQAHGFLLVRGKKGGKQTSMLISADGQRIARPLRGTRLLSPGGAGKVGVLQSELLTARETTLAFIIAIVNIKISIRL